VASQDEKAVTRFTKLMVLDRAGRRSIVLEVIAPPLFLFLLGTGLLMPSSQSVTAFMRLFRLIAVVICCYGSCLLTERVAVVEAAWAYRGCHTDHREPQMDPVTNLPRWEEFPQTISYERCRLLAKDMNCENMGILPDSGHCFTCANSTSRRATFTHAVPQTVLCAKEDLFVFEYVNNGKPDDCYPNSPLYCVSSHQESLAELRGYVANMPPCKSTIDVRKGFIDSCYGFKFATENRHHQCKRVFRNVLAHHRIQLDNPPRFEENHPPFNILDDFTMNGNVSLWHRLFKDELRSIFAEPRIWTQKSLDEATNFCQDLPPHQCRAFVPVSNMVLRAIGEAEVSIDGFSTGNIKSAEGVLNVSTYSGPALIGGSVAHLVRGHTGLVLGSSTPWMEAMLLKAGAAHVITVDFVSIVSHVPDISTLTPAQLAAAYLAGAWVPVDFAVAFSTVAHAGLGRYGDILDGAADLKTMAQLHCILRPGGYLFLSVPVSRDFLVYNMHRSYGSVRLPRLLEGWEIVDYVGVLDFMNAIFLDVETSFIILRKMS
jgi:hypothetical protein